MVLGRILFFVALTTSSAADCVEEDETSFVQVKQLVQQGSKRIPNEAAGWPSPVHDWDAVVEARSSPSLDTSPAMDMGDVLDSFGKNKAHVEDEIEKGAADRIDFASKQRKERKLDYQEAADKVTADKNAVEKEYKADKAAVASVKKARAELVKDDAAKVKAAKQAAEAHAIKAAQADSAATLGRKVGTIAGQDNAHHAWEDYAAKVKQEHDAASLKVVRDNLAAQTAAWKSNIEKHTAAMAAADKSWVARADRAATVAKARAAAHAAKAEVAVEGPEGLRNKMTDVKADWATLHYDREADASQADINADVGGSIGIHQSVTDYDAAGPPPGMDVPLGLEFTPPGAGLGTTAFQKALAGAEE